MRVLLLALLLSCPMACSETPAPFAKQDKILSYYNSFAKTSCP